ncbi:uncharacterized protein EDB93DRAFT_1238045 [Suillus bovinus]|uniref:uncharacterized protein n=1 Tax=Suillus bovinus TaxID=48563 RepID=UPI001B875A69|nr:uncharacterized protein EDB93DRAFT_1238045 [Suillus bovinus]KAG2158271.1 hypothetical protein EDB93DRAFT_1238045 [Suillus bovinus]
MSKVWENIYQGKQSVGESLEEKYEGARACYSENGSTFWDVFNADEFAEYRKDNLFYPFASKEEWEVADYLLRSSLSMAAIDEFLRLHMIQNLQLSFSNASELCSHAEMLPSGPSWKCQTIPSLHPTKLPICLFWRDPIECLESLFSNPLFHDKLDFIPHRMYKMAVQLLRVYSEWLTGNSAWDVQDRPSTLLGVTNIHMHTRMKLSPKAFMLTALLPIPKYLHPNQQMCGMLEDHLVHECLSIVLKPLMIVAEVGIMMYDLVGNVQHCFMPLAVYIVDTPEAAMLACVRGKTSPFTMAFITVDPNDLKAYFEACAEHRLNGVHAPFWKGFPHADPSIFLMPEPLHHWHKEFYDHNLQWCLKVVGAQELDFRFSILQPITGYHHFAGGISKLKQVTGRVHCDIQHYIVGLISDCPAPDNNLLSCIDQSLLTFHENKNVIMTLGAWMGAKKLIDNWFIPKLELLQSITSSMHKIGALIQWSADATEHAHVSKIKDPVQHTNNNDYDPQIRRFLDCQEKLRHFAIATTLKSHNPVDVAEENEGEEDDIDPDEGEPSDPQTALLEEMNQTHITMNYFSKAKQFATLSCRELAYPPQTFIGGTTAIHLNYGPSRNRVKVGDISVDYNIPDLHVLLSDFLQCDTRGRGVVHEVALRRRPLIDRPPILPFDRVQVWHSVRLQQTSFHDSSIILPAQTVHASPLGPGWPKGRRDFVLVNIDGVAEWPKSGLTGHTICELYLIVRPIARRGSRIKWRDQYLCYVQCLSIGPIDPATGMHTLKHTKHADGSPVGNFILLNQLHAFTNAQLMKATSLHYSHSFFLNKYFDKEIYNAIYYASQ